MECLCIPFLMYGRQYGSPYLAYDASHNNKKKSWKQ